jgi:histidinol-phosphate/aromatic aminotransferase/cobyric acid decarboxylase-like protein
MVTENYTPVVNVDVPAYSTAMTDAEVEEAARETTDYICDLYSTVIESNPNSVVLVDGATPIIMAVFRRLRARGVHVATPKYEQQPDGMLFVAGLTHFQNA